MKHSFLLFCILGLVATACDDEETTSPSAQNIVFSATLAAANENPPITNSEGAAAGSVTITFAPTGGGAYTADFAVNVTGFPQTSVIFAGHIHEGASTVNGPVRVNTGLTQTAPMLTPTGGASLTFTGVAVDSTLAQAIFNNPGGWYFNLHTPLNTGGVVRGQLVRR